MLFELRLFELLNVNQDLYTCEQVGTKYLHEYNQTSDHLFISTAFLCVIHKKTVHVYVGMLTLNMDVAKKTVRGLFL